VPHEPSAAPNVAQSPSAGSPRPESAILVFKAVLAEVCENCGEAYISEESSRQFLEDAERALRAGVQVDVREFMPTPA
jgi:hypothetical protein